MKKKATTAFRGKKVYKDQELGFLLSKCEVLEGRAVGLAHLVSSCPTQSWTQTRSQQTLIGRVRREVRGGASIIWGKVFVTTLICMTSPVFYFPPAIRYLCEVRGGGQR